MGYEVENFCCCLSLETGTKIIGAVLLFCGISSLIVGATNYGSDDLNASITVVQGVIFTICGILLIIGVIKRKAAYLFPFLFAMAVGIIKYTIEFIVDLNKSLSSEHVDTTKIISKTMADVMFIGLGIYFLLVVYTLYKQFKSSLSSNGGIA